MTQKIVKDLSSKITKGMIDKEHLISASKKYYQALQGPLYKRIFRKFLYSKQSEIVQNTEEFHRDLEYLIVHDMKLDLKETQLTQLRRFWSKSEVARSWIVSLSLQGALNYASYQATGSFIFLPVTVPKFQTLRFDQESPEARKFSLYFHGAATTLLNTYYAVTLAMFVADPTIHTQAKQIIDTIVVTSAQAKAREENTNHLVEESDELLQRVGDLVKQMEAEKAAQSK